MTTITPHRNIQPLAKLNQQIVRKHEDDSPAVISQPIDHEVPDEDKGFVARLLMSIINYFIPDDEN